MLTLVVLAAGMGSRYGGLKQVDPVGPQGEILLEYSIYDAVAAGFERIVCVIRRDFETDFDRLIGARVRSKVRLDYAYQSLKDVPAGCLLDGQRSKPWGTAHAIWSARDLVQEPFLAINADDFYGRSSYRLLGEYLSREPGYAMAGFRLGNTLSEFGSVTRGLCDTDAMGRLTKVVEHTKIESRPPGAISLEAAGGPQSLTGEEIVSMNFWGLRPPIFGQIEEQLGAFLQNGPGLKAELLIPTVLDRIIQQGAGEVRVLKSPEAWFGVTYPEDKPRVAEALQRLVEAGQYPPNLWKSC